MKRVELELKAGLAPADFAQLSRRLARTHGTSSPAMLTTRYLDTADGRLAQAGVALRLRSMAGTHLLSVKSARTTVGGFQQAREIEVPLPGARVELATLPERALAAELAALSGSAALAPRFETRVRRKLIRIARPHGMVDVALDRGQIRAGASSEPVCEAEFELAAGSPEAIFEVAESLLARIPARLDLPSKAARGEALARHAPLLPPPLVDKPLAPARGTPAAEAFESRLAHLAPVIARTVFATLTDDAPEGPHQLRVALRRLRVALRLFRPILAPEDARALAATARTLGRLVSPLRDADVLVGDLLLPLATSEDPELAQALASWHGQTRANVRAQLRAAGATGFAIRLLRLASLGGWQRPGARARLAMPFETVLAPGLERLWKTIRHRGRRLAELDPETRHELRKDLKKLRYGTEYAGEREEAKAFLSALKRLQEDLGAINDLAVLVGFAPELPAEVAARFAALAERLHKRDKARADTLMGRACRHWRALASTEPWWRHAATPAPPALAAPSP
ncbi:CYTH and CHAD domain-containing protein [Thermaurantiacus sp.]